MKNNKKTIFIILGVLAIIGLIVLALSIKLNGDVNKTKYTQKILNNNIIEDAVVNDIHLEYGKIEYIDGMYHIGMTAINKGKEAADLSDYKIIFKDINDIELDWVRGTSVGEVKPGESFNFYIDTYTDLSNLDHIDYIYFNFEN